MSVLIFAEQRNGAFRKPAFEAVSTGAKLAKALATDAVVAVLGSGMQDQCAALGKFGASRVLYADDPKLAQYSTISYAEALTQIAKKVGAKVVLLSATALGRDLSPRVAVKLEGGLAMDITDYAVEGGSLVITRPVYAGKAYQKLKINADVQIIVLRPNVFAAEESGGQATVESFTTELKDSRISVKDVVLAESRKKELTEADVIVSGGRGLKGPEHWNLISDLAEALGAAQGASRAVVDAGWRPHEEQVGQTGKTVTPQLYIACGISGAIQHLAGMSSSKYIVAINKDAEAPIFKIADYGLVGDVFQILPAFTEAVRKVKAG